MSSFTQLDIWQKGLLLVEQIYLLTKKFPREEMFGLTSQVRRSSASILANFAEGFSRSSPLDKSHKYVIARGECSETKAFLLIAESLGYVEREDLSNSLELCEKVGQMLSGLIRKYSGKTEPKPEFEPLAKRA